jgi:carbon-monoxide dehydrogenase medium subunit
MKPVAFDYARPAAIADALALLAGNPGAKVLAGGQTLGPMLNLRLAQPALLVDITRIPELAAVEAKWDYTLIGATVTHAAIEDRRVPEGTGGFLARVAHGIAYRAVRNRGTIGGSLAHADPAADWLTCLAALGAEVVVAGSSGERRIPVARFVRSAMDTELGDAEVVRAVRIPRFSRHASFGFHKICRKTGEFADAIGVAVRDPDLGVDRVAASTATGAPIVLEMKEAGGAGIGERLRAAGFSGDAYDLQLAVVAVRRAATEAEAA